MASRTTGPLLQSVSARALLVAPLRLVLGLAGLAVAAVAAEDPNAALLAFALGALGILVAFLSSRRTLADPQPVPAFARYASPLQVLASAAMPSTVAVAVLTAVAAPFRPELGALLAGVLGGMGLGAAVYGVQLWLRERTQGETLYVAHGAKRLYVAPRGDAVNPGGALPAGPP